MNVHFYTTVLSQSSHQRTRSALRLQGVAVNWIFSFRIKYVDLEGILGLAAVAVADTVAVDVAADVHVDVCDDDDERETPWTEVVG